MKTMTKEVAANSANRAQELSMAETDEVGGGSFSLAWPAGNPWLRRSTGPMAGGYVHA